MSGPIRAPRLFLSHAGVDREAAATLARRIEEAPDARRHGLTVWLDVRGTEGGNGMRLGESWQAQIEREIAASTAFAVLVPPLGVPFWVDVEMRLALNRAAECHARGEPYPFVPIAPPGRRLESLPNTVQLYQAALDLRDEDLAAILSAVLQRDGHQPIALVDQPFMGLRAFDAEVAGLFFGRATESDDLVKRLKARNLVMVVADSGAGKSSLVKAGLVPRFREGCFSAEPWRRPRPGEWHVVQMRPGSDPFEGLANGVADAARNTDRPYDAGTHGTWIRSRDAGSIADALRETRPSGSKLLLVVDQFEELWTLTRDTLRQPFIDALLSLVREGDFGVRVVGTMRRDHFALCRDAAAFWARLDGGPMGGRFLLPRISEAGLREAIIKPLALAGVGNQAAVALADVVVRDVTDQPGDLALLEMALTLGWSERAEHQHDLLRAYEHIGRVEGALATAAEVTFTNPNRSPSLLGDAERPLAEALFMRLVRAGDASGATRRVAKRSELSDRHWAVAQKLATQECQRLIVIGDGSRRSANEGAASDTNGAPSDTSDPSGEATVELAHEQLITQWSRYQGWLRNSPDDPSRVEDKRRLDRLIEAAARWFGRGQRSEDLARGGELEEFRQLAKDPRRDLWLAKTERDFVDASARHARIRRVIGWGSVAAVVAISIAAATISFRFWREAERRATAVEAKLLWDPLEFADGGDFTDEYRALARLAASSSDVKDAFLAEMLQNDAIADRFCRAPALIAHPLMGIDKSRRGSLQRALNGQPRTGSTASDRVLVAIGLMACEAESGQVELILAAIHRTTNRFQLAALRDGLAALAPRLDDQQAARALGSILAAIPTTTDSDQLAALGDGLAALAPRLDDQQASRAVGSILAAIPTATDSDQLAALGDGLAALAPRLDDQHASRAVNSILPATPRTANRAQIFALSHGLAACVLRLDRSETSRAVDAILDATLAEGSLTEPFVYPLRRNPRAKKVDLVNRLAALAPRLDNQQASRAVDFILEAICWTTDRLQIAALRNCLVALAPRLDDQQASRAVNSILAAIPKNTDLYQLGALGDGLAAFAPRLDDQQASRAVDSTLAAINKMRDRDPLVTAIEQRVIIEFEPRWSESLYDATSHPLAWCEDRLDTHQASRAIDSILAAIPTTTDSDQLAAFGCGLAACATGLDGQDASRAVHSILALIGKLPHRQRLDPFGKRPPSVSTRDAVVESAVTLHVDHQFAAVATGLAACAARLEGQFASRTVDALLDAIARTDHSRELAALGTGLAALAPRLDDQQASRAAGSILAVISTTNDSDQLVALVNGLAALAPRLDDQQASRAVDSILAAIPTTNDSDQLAALGTGLAALAPRLDDQQASRAVDSILAAIPTTNDSDQLAALGIVLAALAPRVDDRQASRAVGSILAAIPTTAVRDELTALSSVLAALAPRLDAQEASRAVDSMLAAIPTTTDTAQLTALGTGLAALAPRLDGRQTSRAVDSVLAAIAESTDPSRIRALIEVLVQLSQSLDREVAGRALLRAMQAPNVAMPDDSPRATLEAALRARFILEMAPSEEAGRWELIAWAENRFPDFDFESMLLPRSLLAPGE